MAIKQARVDHNKGLIYDKFDVVNKLLNRVEYENGGLTSKQKKTVDDFVDSLNRSLRSDISDNNITERILLWMDEWYEYFKSWEREETNNFINESENLNKEFFNVKLPKKITVCSYTPMFDRPDSNNGRKIKDIENEEVILLEYVKGTNYCKIKCNGKIGYILKVWIK